MVFTHYLRRFQRKPKLTPLLGYVVTLTRVADNPLLDCSAFTFESEFYVIHKHTTYFCTHNYCVIHDS